MTYSRNELNCYLILGENIYLTLSVMFTCNGRVDDSIFLDVLVKDKYVFEYIWENHFLFYYKTLNTLVRLHHI